jgi:hypothetical protein
MATVPLDYSIDHSLVRVSASKAHEGVSLSHPERGEKIITLAVLYEGATPRFIGGVSASGVHGPVDVDAEIRHWIACRLKNAAVDPRKLFFLRLDLETNLALVNTTWTDEQWDRAFPGPLGPLANRVIRRSRTPAERARRIRAVQSSMSMAERRIQQRVKPNTTRSVFELGTLDIYDDITSIFRSLFIDVFGNDQRLIDEALEAFACGQIAQECDPLHSGLYGTMYASDADSNAVFLFAEFALLVLDTVSRDREIANHPIGRDLQAFWTRHANSMLRMARIYIERWKGHPNATCFRSLGIPPCPLDASTCAAVIKQIKSAGEDIARLETLSTDMLLPLTEDPRCL